MPLLPTLAFPSPHQAGGAAGTAVDVALFPIDTIKTRLQSADGFVKAGGFRGVYSGLLAAGIGSAPGGKTRARMGRHSVAVLNTNSIDASHVDTAANHRRHRNEHWEASTGKRARGSLKQQRPLPLHEKGLAAKGWAATGWVWKEGRLAGKGRGKAASQVSSEARLLRLDHCS